MVYVLLLVDISFFVWEMVKNNGFEQILVNPMFGPSSQTMLDLGAKWAPFILAGDFWRFVSPIVLHSGLINLICIMGFQFQIGRQLESIIGAWRFLILYICSGIGGNILSAIFLPDMLGVGAGSSLFGLFGATFARIILLWKMYKKPARSCACSLVSLIFMLGLGLLPGLDNFAHVGGFLIGFPLGLCLISTIQAVRKDSGYNSLFCAGFGFIITVSFFVLGLTLFYLQLDVNTWCTWCKYFNCLDLQLVNGPDYCANPFPPNIDPVPVPQQFHG